MMELYIETLTGTFFELRVSPFETIMSVKAKIQRLEGIPIGQQHLIWQSMELEDDYCLHDYSIHDGATLKLVLAMRGGPINTRRIPMEDPTIREMAEYVEANRDEIWEKVPGNRQVTLLVFREGDQLNFFRVVDRGDGTLTPLSESLSGASMYNFNDEEEEEEAPPKEKLEENEQLKEKMKMLRGRMEKLTISKKPRKKPRPPSSGHSSGRARLRQLPHSGRTLGHLNRNRCLPPVGHALSSPFSKEEKFSSEKEELTVNTADHDKSFTEHSVGITSKLSPSLTSVGENDRLSSDVKESDTIDKISQLLNIATEKLKTPSEEEGDKTPLKGNLDLQRLSSLQEESKSPVRKKDLTVETLKETLRSPTSSKSKPKLKGGDITLENLKEVLGRPTTSSRDLNLDPPRTSSKCKGRKEFTLESLSSSEARAMSGLLRQASLEKIGSSRIGNFVPSGSKSRLSNYALGSAGLPDGRITTPEGRLVSARLQRVTSSRDGRLLSPSHRLPPVKAKKKATKRCYVCGKKTGLATSYICRCGNNFCATHRYAESHDCSFDYKTEGRKLLEQSNPVVSAPKLPKI